VIGHIPVRPVYEAQSFEIALSLTFMLNSAGSIMALHCLTFMRILRIAAVGLVGFSFASMYVLHIHQVGFSLTTANGKSEVSAGSHPIMLIWFGLSIALYVALMVVNDDTVAFGKATMKRRTVAFLVDFWFSLLGLSAFGALLPLYLEAIRTGHFFWTFERSYTESTDVLFGVPLILVTMGLMFLYFVIPLTKGKQTVGCLVMGIKVTPPFGEEGQFTFPQAVRRTWFEFRGLCTLPFNLFNLKDGRGSDGRTWYDIETNCRVVLVKHE
jgi:uncharacterized RDD family membrane protein YckC